MKNTPLGVQVLWHHRSASQPVLLGCFSAFRTVVPYSAPEVIAIFIDSGSVHKPCCSHSIHQSLV